jgi:hypothetical protein
VTIFEFLAARLNERETIAAAAHGIWQADFEGNIVDVSYAAYLAVGPYGNGIDDATRAHILLNDPARVLREVEADREILAMADRAVNGIDADMAVSDALDRVLRLRAAAYSDHPDYRQEWAA